MLSKGLHHMMHLLQAHISMQHYNTYPYGLQMVSMPTSLPSTDVSFSPSSAYRLRSEQASSGSPGAPYTARRGCGAATTEGHTTGCQSQLHPSPSSIQGPCPAPSQGSENTSTPSEWSTGPLLNISCGSQGESPFDAPHGPGLKTSDSRPLRASQPAVSQSQPTLCLQPPTDAHRFSCYLTSQPSGASTQSLLDSSPTTNPHPPCLPAEPSFKTTRDKREEIGLVPSATSPACARNVMEDSSIFQIKDACPTMLPVSASPTPSSLPARRPSLEMGPSQSESLDPRLPLCDPPATLERLLGNGAFEEGGDK